MVRSLSRYATSLLIIIAILSLTLYYTRRYGLTIGGRRTTDNFIDIILISLGSATSIYVLFLRLLPSELGKYYLKHSLENARASGKLASDMSTSPALAAVKHLNDQAKKLSTRASSIYWTIIVTLLAGVFIIIFAGRLANLDSTYATILEQIAQRRKNVTDERSDIDNFALSLRKSGSENADYNEDLSKELTIIHGYLEADLSSLRKQEEDATAKWLERSSSGSEKSWNWTSTILRVSVIGMLVFLIQILVSLYRYNSRLIAFYSSRRDAIIMAGTDPDKARIYIELLFPESLDFGRMPQHPLHEMAALLRDVGEKADQAIRVATPFSRRTSPYSSPQPDSANDGQPSANATRSG